MEFVGCMDTWIRGGKDMNDEQMSESEMCILVLANIFGAGQIPIPIPMIDTYLRI